MPLPAFLVKGGTKDLFAYYSRSGNTRKAAERIASLLDAELLEIEMTKPIPEGFGKYLVGGSQALKGSRPEIRCRQVGFASYGRIVLGAPIWAGKAASPINTFLRDYPISEKVVGFFDTSLSGKDERCVEALRKALPKLASTVALYDRGRDDASGNEARIKAFVGELGCLDA